MNVRAPRATAALLAAAVALASCGKQDDQSAAAEPSVPTGSASQPMAAADCDRLPDPEPKDDSAAGRATAVNQGAAARAACKRGVTAPQSNGDLARIREIKEKEQADQATRKLSEKEWGKRLNEGANKPLQEFKY